MPDWHANVRTTRGGAGCGSPYRSSGITIEAVHSFYRSMKTHLLLVTVAIALVGCATVSEPVPKDYKGPVVQLADTGASEGGSKGRFFAALEIDGNGVMNSLRETRSASYGQGFLLTAKFTTRNVPVRPMKVRLIGTHQTAAPIHEIASRMAGTFFSVDGVVDFKPVEGKRYEVTGELKKERSCVWIADAETKAEATEQVCAK